MWCSAVLVSPGVSLNTSGLLSTRSTSCCHWSVEIVGLVVNVPPGSGCGVISSESASSSSGMLTVITLQPQESAKTSGY